MYLWYSCSKICIVYLQDVPQRSMLDSEWLDRGWTLQELIAPKVVSFFDHHWTPIATKLEIISSLSRKTRIPESVLIHGTKPSTCSIAQRISWAAERITKRVEDRAYSLMGLFNINMPMIYGEREKAFLRLQQHIIQKSKDESIFAWSMGHDMGAYSGLYAPSPSAYINCSDVVQTPGSRGFTETNGVLSITLRLFLHSVGMYCAILHCNIGAGADAGDKVCIVVARTSNWNEYIRERDPENVSWGTIPASSWGHLVGQQIRVPVEPNEPPLKIFYGFWLRTLQPPSHAKCHITILSNCQAPETDYVCQYSSAQGNTGIVRISPKKKIQLQHFEMVRDSLDEVRIYQGLQSCAVAGKRQSIWTTTGIVRASSSVWVPIPGTQESHERRSNRYP